MHNNSLRFLIILSVLAPAVPAHAYIGPGAGAGTIAVVLGILASFVMAVIALVWYPAKRLFKKRATDKAPQSVPDGANAP